MSTPLAYRNSYLQGSSLTNYNTGPVDPFRDQSSWFLPISKAAMLRHSEFFALSNEILREAYRRISAYFITDLKITGKPSTDEKKNYLAYLKDDMGIISFLVEASTAVLVYGNGYFSVIRPILRSVVCPKKGCRAIYAFNKFADPRHKKVFDFKWDNAIFGKCPRCGFEGDFGEPKDEYDPSRPLILRSWSPHEIQVSEYSHWTGSSSSYDWMIPPDFKSGIKRGDVHLLADTPWEIIQAAIKNQDFQFDSDFIHHWRDDCLPGIDSRGMGIPRAITNYRVLFQLQMYARTNEAIASGHVLPIRVVSPKQAGGDPNAGNPLANLNQGNMQSKFFNMVNAHKHDPDTWHYSPVPLEFQAIGADARTLIQKEHIEQLMDRLLNGIGMPVELYKGSLQTTTAPVGLRLVERWWAPFIHGANRLLSHIGDKTVSYKKWNEVEFSLEPVTIVDAIEKNQMKTQLAMGGMASRTEGLKPIGLDFEADTRQKYDEQMVEAIIADDAQRKIEQLGLTSQIAAQANPVNLMMAQQQQQAQGGQQGAGGQAAPQGGGAPAGGQDPNAQGGGGQPPQIPSATQAVDPTSFMASAESYAQWLMSSVPDSQRSGQLMQLKKTNDLFHAAVRRKMEDLRTQQASKARAEQEATVQQ